MSIHIPHPAVVFARWAGRVRIEVVELAEDVRRVWQGRAYRLREDPDYRNALLQGVLRGLLNALARGPRATILWVVALIIEVALEILRALNSMGQPPEAYGYDW